jgi:hypothetical protein
MPEIDATIDGARIKVILKPNKGQWFAKPKDQDISTPHFYDDGQGLEVHQDSPDGTCYRVMYAESICSGSYPSGKSWVSNKGMDLAVLPMQEQADGFSISTTPSGSSLWLPADSYCLMAVGRWSEWMLKAPKAAGVSL